MLSFVLGVGLLLAAFLSGPQPIAAQQLELSTDYNVSELSGHSGVGTAVLDFETVPITGFEITQKGSSKYWPCDLAIYHNRDSDLVFAATPEQGPVRSRTDDYSLYYQWCGGSQLSLGPGGGTGSGTGRELLAEHPDGYYLQSLRVCTNRRKNNRIKGIQTSAVRAIRDESSGEVRLQDVTTTSDANPNCTDWHPIVRCSREDDEVASGLRIRYNERSRTKHSFTGLELICRKVISTVSETARSGLESRDADGAEAESAPEIAIEGNWLRRDSNNPQNDGMRISVEGDRATLTAIPGSGHDAFQVGNVLWKGISNDGRLEVRGSNGRYYGAYITMEGANRLHIDIDDDPGPGYEQTWERAGPSIDGDWVLIEASDGANEGLQVQVQGSQATLRFVPPTASRSFRVGARTWRDIGGGDQPHLGELDALTTSREYRTAQFRLLDENRLRVVFDAGGTVQLWARPGVAEELIAARERGEPLTNVPQPQEPADDPLAQGGDLEQPDDLPELDIPEDPTPPVPEAENAACLTTSLRHDAMDVDWGWGITAPRPSTVHMVSELTDWSAAEREEYEIGVSLPRHEGVAQQSGMFVDMDRSIVPGLEDHDSFIWQGNEGGREWQHQPNLTAEELSTTIADFKDDGFRFRPIDLEGYTKSSDVRFTAVWLRNHEGVEWQAEFDLTSSQYGSLYQQYREDGYRLTDVEIYSTPGGGLRYAGIWVKSCDNSNWRQYRNLTEEQFEARDRELGVSTFEIIDFESYMSSQGQLYAAIWEKVPNRRWVADPDLDLKSFLNRYHDLSDAGFRLIDYESYETSNGPRYAGVWAENDPRIRYEAKAALDNLVTSYRQANDLTGMSVVIIEDGDVVYRRGFGWADSLAGKRAHAQTVYLTASVSKVIGATLAAKLEERMAGGLDLTATTIQYLGQPANEYLDMGFDCSSLIAESQWRCKSLPDDHTHTVEQLLSKTGCIHHYSDTNSQTPNRSRFYKWRGRALVQIWDAGLLPNCVPGRHYRYSTHSFTYVGAVLEAVTGKPIARLLQDEIAQPLGLHSIRAMHTRGGLIANYDRSTAYTLSNTSTTNTGALVTQPGPNNRSIATNYEDNTSWKVLGGGIESNALDLAWFGWKLLDGEIVSEETLDRMWIPDADQEDYNSVAPNPVRQGTIPGGVSGIGLAWEFGIDTRSRWLRHAGDGTGAGSYIKIWRDRDVVIAMLSNRRWHVNQSRNRLLDNLAQVVMDATRP